MIGFGPVSRPPPRRAAVMRAGANGPVGGGSTSENHRMPDYGRTGIACSAARFRLPGHHQNWPRATKWLGRPENLAALADLPGQWIDKVCRRRSLTTIVLDMDSSE